MRNIFFALLFLPLLCAGQSGAIQKTIGFTYTAGVPTFIPSPVAKSSEIVQDTTTKDIYFWNRYTQTWDKQGRGYDEIPGALAPLYTPTYTDSKLVINAANELYRWRSGVTWDCINCVATIVTTARLSGNGSAGSPLDIAQQGASAGQVLKWSGSTWQPGSDNNTTYTAGSGISINGSNVIANTLPDQTVVITGATGTYPSFTLPDQSATNELNTAFDVSGGNLRVIDAGATRTVALTSIAPIQSIAGGTGISVSGTNALTVTNTGDLSATNEIQQLDTVRVNGSNLELSLSLDGVPAKTVPVASIAPVQAVAAGAGISISGTTTRTITNSAPDQTVTITGAGINSVTGTYPNFTITGTEVDGSTTNELQNLSLTGQSLGISSGTGVTLPIVDVVAGTNVTVTKAAGVATINAAAAGWSLTGNSISAGANFLGTTNNASLRFRANTARMILDTLNRLGIGTDSPNGQVSAIGFTKTSSQATDAVFDINSFVHTALSGQTHKLVGLNIDGTQTFNTLNQEGTALRINISSNATANQIIRPVDINYFANAQAGTRIQNSSTGSSASADILLSTGSGANSSYFNIVSGNSNLPYIARGITFVDVTNNRYWGLGTVNSSQLAFFHNSAGGPGSVDPTMWLRNNMVWIGQYNPINVTTNATLHVRSANATSSNNAFLVQNSTPSDLFKIRNDGQFSIWTTNTAAGTTGAQTINRPTGTVNFAAGATSLTVTNSLCSTTSIVIPVIRTNDATASIKNVVPGAGSFTITLTAAATAETSVGFWIIN